MFQQKSSNLVASYVTLQIKVYNVPLSMTSTGTCPKGTGLPSNAPANWTQADCKKCESLTYNDGSYVTCQSCSNYVDVAHTSCTTECPFGQSLFFPGAHTCVCDAGSEEVDGKCVSCEHGYVSTKMEACNPCPDSKYAAPDQKSCFTSAQCTKAGGQLINNVACVCGQNSVYKDNKCQCDDGFREENNQCVKCRSGTASFKGLSCVDCNTQPSPNNIASLDQKNCIDRSECLAEPLATIIDGQCECQDGAIKTVVDGKTRCVCPGNQFLTIQKVKDVKSSRKFSSKLFKNSIQRTSASISDVCNPCNSGIQSIDGFSCFNEFSCINAGNTKIEDGRCQCIEGGVAQDNQCSCPNERPYISVDKTSCVDTCRDGATPVKDPVTGDIVCTCNGGITGLDGNSCTSAFECDQLKFTEIVDGRCVCDPEVSELNVVDNTCQCKDGTYMAPDEKQCVSQCPDGTDTVENGKYCRCSEGNVLHPNKQKCINQELCTGTAQIDPETGFCICTGGATPDDNGVCSSCNDYLTPDGQCVTQCPANSTLNGNNCVCNIGFGFYDGECIKCPSGTVYDDSSKTCVNCDEDQVASIQQDKCIMSSQCANGAGTAVDSENPQCVCFDGATYNPTTDSCDCPEGNFFALVETSCVQDCGANTTISDKQCQCFDGYVIGLNDRKCISEADCVNQGGEIQNGQCECRENFKPSNDHIRCIADGQCDVLEKFEDENCVCVNNAEREYNTDQTIGACKCREGYFHNITGNSCERCGRGEAVSLDGLSCVPDNNCGDILAIIDSSAGYDRCICIANSTFGENGSCICNDGTGQSLDRKSCGDCQVNSFNVNNECQCVQNFTLYNIEKDVFCVPSICEAGYALNGTDAATSHMSVSLAKKTTNSSLFCSPCKDGWAQDGMSSQGVQCNQTGLVADLTHKFCVSDSNCGANTHLDKFQCVCNKGYKLTDDECVKSKASVSIVIAAISLLCAILFVALIALKIAKSKVQKERKQIGVTPIISEQTSTLNNTRE